jgi:hypothetical protein
MKVCATSEGAISENAEISNPSTHQNDDSSASPSLATDSEGEEQKVLRRARKRNRFRAKQRKRRGQKGKRKKKPRRSRASEQSDAEMDVDSSDASLSMDEEDATEDDSDTASETSTSSSDEDDEILENLQKYVGKGFVTYAAAMGKGRDDVKPYVLEPLSLKDDAAIMCPHCQCRKWKGEKTNCCDGGTKLWPDYEPPPPHIIDIYRDRDFYAQQRRYNALFAMTAFGANKGPVIEKTPKTWVTYPGKSMLTLCGRAYHRIFDPLAPYEDECKEVQNLARLYLTDFGGHQAVAEKDKKLDFNFVKAIRDALLQVNTWAHTYLAVIDEVHEANSGEVGDARIVFAPTSRAEHGPIVGDAPSSAVPEIAAVIFKDRVHSQRSAYGPTQLPSPLKPTSFNSTITLLMPPPTKPKNCYSFYP